MNYLITGVLGLLSVMLAYITLDVEKAKKVKCLHTERAEKQKNLSKKSIFAIVFVLTLVVALLEIKMTTEVDDVLNLIKMNIALICLVGSACVDYREHRIPNIFPAVLALSAVVLLTLGVLIKQDQALAYINSGVFACVVLGAGLVVASIVSRSGIGMGDVKIICALALMCGIYSVCSTLFIGVVISSIVAIILLITKKMTMKGSLPFGPFILAGYLLSTIFSFY